ncbi:hypothetical protein [Nocardia sp. CA-120079]|uniref:hypothetical protein n=1 Tax=Nocardia sp. CA-120079 TaxID=3239974 RepID=UPI003D99F3DB
MSGTATQLTHHRSAADPPATTSRNSVGGDNGGHTAASRPAVHQHCRTDAGTDRGMP